jgi:hypothetical protein
MDWKRVPTEARDAWQMAFPSMQLGTRAPIPYELGVALLIAWVGGSVYRIEGVRARYPSDYWFWRFVDDLDLEKLAPWWCLASCFFICWGLFCRLLGRNSGKIQRAIGLAMGGMIFGFIALGHLLVTFWSVAGPVYAFFAWRFLILASVYIRTL